MKVLVRQAAVDDQEALFGFIRTAYRGRERFKIPLRWQWQFPGNPFGQKQFGPTELPIWIALDGSRIVGQTGAMIEPLVIGGPSSPRTISVGWSVDTMVSPSHRGQGIGGRLQQANQDHHPVFMSLKMAPRNARIKKKLGAFNLPPVRVYRLLLRAETSAVASRLARISPVPETIWPKTFFGGSRFFGPNRFGGALLAQLALAKARGKWIHRRRGAQHVLSTLEFEEIDRFGSETDQLWRQVGSHFRLIVRRDSEYLNWKFVRQPHVRYRRFLVRRRRPWGNGHVCGYLILRRCAPPEPNLGLIVDLFALPTDHQLLRAMAVFAVDRFQQEGVTAVKAAAGAGPLAEAYRSLGFKVVKELAPLCHFSPELADATSHLRSDIQSGVAVAFFGLGDHDLDQYPLAK